MRDRRRQDQHHTNVARWYMVRDHDQVASQLHVIVHPRCGGGVPPRLLRQHVEPVVSRLGLVKASEPLHRVALRLFRPAAAAAAATSTWPRTRRPRQRVGLCLRESRDLRFDLGDRRHLVGGGRESVEARLRHSALDARSRWQMVAVDG